jgi:HPt (histidine-containing phosphotransfer) domain-containing protein
VADTHVDRDVLSALQDVMEESYLELLDTFLADSESRLRELKISDDAATLANVAHSFKGSSSNMGAVRLAELCHELEQRVKVISVAATRKMVDDSPGEFAIVRPVYEAERQRSPAH